MGNDCVSRSRQREFQQMVIRFIGQIGAPAIVDRHPPAALRQCRSRLAEEQNVPAYVIFADATLQQMLEKRPQSLESLRDISGVGDRKLELYGTEFLAVLRQG